MTEIGSGRAVPEVGEDSPPVDATSLRAAVLGANDGVVSNASLVMGVAGAVAQGAVEPKTVVVSGLAGLIAGAFSMAMGEWISVRSAAEAAGRQVTLARRRLRADPDGERGDLERGLRDLGLNGVEATTVARRLLSDPESAVQVHSRAVAGVTPDDLAASPWRAAITSFFLFAVGAFLPVVPFLLWEGQVAVASSIAVSLVALFCLGAAITRFTGRSVLRSGLRQTAIGALATATTYAVGTLIGVGVGG